jgi:ribonuclease P/MRP protein subunit POP5
MTVRPPTLREKRRYLLVRVDPAGTPVDQKELYYAISDAVTSLWGDSVAAFIMQAVVAADGPWVIIRCRRGTERELALALSTVTSCRDTRIALRIIAASGTMESLRDRIKPEKEPKEPSADPDREPACTFDKKLCGIVHCDGQKIDVIEKGFKNTHRLFLTSDDLEES